MFGEIVLSFEFIIIGMVCLSYGFLHPIELVEEWGCYDTEIRLTCGHLDSKIAILEATFMPNCTQDNCFQAYLKNFERAFPIQNDINFRTTDIKYGHKFGEKSVKIYENDENLNPEFNINNLLEPIPEHYFNHNNKGHTSLRSAIERLIVKYLRQYSPNENYYHRVKRYENLLKTFNNEKSMKNIEIGVRNITINEDEIQYQNEENEKNFKKLHKTNSLCPEQRRKVSSLSFRDIENSFQNETSLVQNIRRILNRRCSGKNHCSFLFAFDHPFSEFWKNGTIHIKYICMEKYRINHYCNEHLIIGEETTNNNGKGEPIAEARVQGNEQSFHSLKILKSPDITDSVSIEYKKKRKPKKKLEKLKENIEELEESQGIYSQDFKLLKILPNNLDNFYDIAEIGDEIYFRTNEEDLGTSSPIKFSNSITENSLQFPNLDNNSEFLFNSYQYNNNLSNNVTMLIREGEYIVTFPKYETIENYSDNISTIGATTSVSTSSDSGEPFEEISTSGVYNKDTMNLEQYTTDNPPMKQQLEEQILYDNFETENIINYDSNRHSYNSIQRTMLKRPLLQGFVMTPGYPKFYIGDSECKSIIIAPIGQKIRLTILDISLRHEKTCRDFILINDLESDKRLFHSCTELIRPMKIVSDSNRIEIVVKTTTKFAYPKRGVLVHYSGLGCKTPIPPKNGKLIERNETTALFECNPPYIFAETTVNSSQLICTDKQNWDRILPDCVEPTNNQ